MPRYPINRATNFIVEDESWSVIEYDHTSVPGVIYLSLTEGKINSIYDDIINDIADTDRLAQYSLSVPEKVQTFKPGDKIEPKFTLMKNGMPCGAAYKILSAPESKDKTKEKDGQLTVAPDATGEITIIIQLVDYPEIQKTMTIQVSNVDQEFSVYIDGKSTISLDRHATYQLQTTDENYSGANIFQLYKLLVVEESDVEQYDNDDYVLFDHPRIEGAKLALHKSADWANYSAAATITEFAKQYEKESALAVIKENNVVQANNRNKLGFTMLANIYEYDGQFNITFKIIEIVPLW